MSRRADGAILLGIGLLFLTIPGVIYNNLNNSGLVNNSSAMTCSLTTNSCVLSTNVGCQLNPNNCLLSGSTISFFNTNSPFTQMLQGNLFALFTNLNPLSGATSAAQQTSWSGQHGPFDVVGNPIYYTADCQGAPGGASRSQTQWAVGRCTQTTQDGKNVTEANVAKWNNWNTSWNSTVALQFFNLGNGTYPRSCSQLAQINFTLLGNSGYTYFGCTINQGGTIQSVGTQPTHVQWAYLVAMPLSYGVMPVGASHQNLFIQLENWYTSQCLPNINMGYYHSQNCDNFLNGFKGFTIPGTSITFVPNSSGGIVFSFLAGVILLVLGLGLQIGVGGGVSAGSNPQGTKLAQSLGLGLMLWSFFSSQFSGWFTSGILPAGLDGLTGIVGLSIDALIFAGVYLMSQQGAAATTE